MTDTLERVPRRGSRVPPGPAGYPIVGSLPNFARDPLGFLEHCAREYGDVVRMPLGRSPLWLLSHPDDIELVHVRSTRGFDKGYGFKDPLLGNGLVNSEGDFWRRQRRMIQPAFHKRRIDAYGETMVARTERMLERWRDGRTIDVHAEMMRLTLGIIAQTMFGAEVEGEEGAVAQALSAAMDGETGAGFLELPEWVPTPGRLRTKRAVEELDRVVLGIITERRAAAEAGEDRGDLLDMLLAAQDEDGARMTDRQLRDEVMTVFLAGHETTANALTYAFFLLSRNPGAEKALLYELGEVLGGEAPDPSDARRLPYAEAVFKESMRLYPPVWVVSRVATEETEIGGYRVPAGTELATSQWVVHRDGRFYEEPLEFRPTRWLEGDPGLEKRIPRYAYFPFGGGPRQCIGNSFATMEAVLVLAMVAQRFRLEVPPDHRLELQPSVTIRPKGGLPARAHVKA